MPSHVRDAVRQIDDQSWLISDKLVVRRQQPPDSFSAEPAGLWRDSDGGWYTLSDASIPLPATVPLPSDSRVRLVHDAGDASAVWRFGDGDGGACAYLKVKLFQDRHAATREKATLDWLAPRELPCVAVPQALHHFEEADRYYLFVSGVPGKTLADVWRDLDEEQKERYVVRIAGVCRDLAEWRSESITGVDGGQLPDSFLDVLRDPHDFRAETLRRNCSELGMDCSNIVFCHNDLGPYNIVVNPDDQKGSLGIIDWEMAGFVPRDWIRTKFSVSYAMDFAWRDVDAEDASLAEWRKRVAEQLGKMGFPEVAEAYKRWFRTRVAELQT